MSLLAQVQERLGPHKCSGRYCANCPQEFVGERYISPDGIGDCGVLLLGDSPWKNEIEQGKPFVGASGKLLDEAFRALGVRRNSFTVTNAMCCKPPQLGWSDHPEQFVEAAQALAQCRAYLNDTIRERKPRAIVTLGGAALRALCGTNDVTGNQCYILSSEYGIPVIPTYHPSYLLRPAKKKLMFSVLCALRKALDIASGKSGALAQDELLLDPQIDLAKSYLERGLVNGRFPILYVDIETPRAVCSCGRHSKDDAIDCEDRIFDTTGQLGESYTLLRVGLSHTRNTALTVPWQPPYIDLIRDALARADVLVEHAHNHYDKRRLSSNHCVTQGVWASSMWAWHRYQSDLDKALDFCAPFFSNTFPWKHLNESDPARYNALDVARGIDVWLGCKTALEKEGRWASFWEECVEFDNQILGPTQLHGVCVDALAKSALMTELKGEIDQEEQQFLATVPDAARKVTIKRRRPKNAEGYTEVLAPILLKKWHRKSDAKAECIVCYGKGVLDGRKRCPCLKYEITVEQVVWRKEEFNAGSSDQVKSLLRELGITVPRKRDQDGEWKETTGKKQLQRLAKTKPQLRSIILIRERRKIRDTYDWQPDTDGRVRTFYSFNPSTWRLSSFFPNLQTIPKRGPLAPRFRRIIQAVPGHVLGECDSSAIEAVLVGYFGQSDRYLRLAKAGVHGWLTAARLGQPIPLDLPFDELQKRCKAAKGSNPKLYDSMKVTVHGGNYDQEPWGVFEQNPDVFNSPEEAATLQNFYFSTEPGQDVRKWQGDTRQRAAQQRHLQTPYGVKHWFFAVFRYDEYRGDWVPDAQGDGKRCLAFLPQSTAASIQRWYARECVRRYPSMLPFFRLFTHDDIKLEYPESLGEDPIRTLAQVMQEPLPQLGGLTIGVESKVGYSLGEMREIS